MIDTVNIFYPHTVTDTRPRPGLRYTQHTDTNAQLPSGGRGQLHSFSIDNPSTGFHAFGSNSELRYFRASLPRLLYGHNGMVIKSQSELDAGLNLLLEMTHELGDPAVPDFHITRLDMVWQFRGDVAAYNGPLDEARFSALKRENTNLSVLHKELVARVDALIAEVASGKSDLRKSQESGSRHLREKIKLIEEEKKDAQSLLRVTGPNFSLQLSLTAPLMSSNNENPICQWCIQVELEIKKQTTASGICFWKRRIIVWRKMTLSLVMIVNCKAIPESMGRHIFQPRFLPASLTSLYKNNAVPRQTKARIQLIIPPSSKK